MQGPGRLYVSDPPALVTISTPERLRHSVLLCATVFGLFFTFLHSITKKQLPESRLNCLHKRKLETSHRLSLTHAEPNLETADNSQALAQRHLNLTWTIFEIHYLLSQSQSACPSRLQIPSPSPNAGASLTKAHPLSVFKLEEFAELWLIPVAQLRRSHAIRSAVSAKARQQQQGGWTRH